MLRSEIFSSVCTGAYDKLPVKTEDGVFPLIQLGQVVQKSPTLILVNLSASPQVGTLDKALSRLTGRLAYSFILTSCQLQGHLGTNYSRVLLCSCMHLTELFGIRYSKLL